MAWIIVYWWGGIAILITLLESLQANTPLDTLLLLIIMGLGQILIGTGALVVQGSVGVLPFFDNSVTVGIGTLLTLLGAAGMTYCRYMMGHFWSAATALHDEHRVIDKGLWAIIRHPLYAFVVIMYFGTALVFSTWWEWIVFALMIAAHTKKLLDEERYLEGALLGYRDYQQRVRYRILPGIW